MISALITERHGTGMYSGPPAPEPSGVGAQMWPKCHPNVTHVATPLMGEHLMCTHTRDGCVLDAVKNAVLRRMNKAILEVGYHFGNGCCMFEFLRLNLAPQCGSADQCLSFHSGRRSRKRGSQPEWSAGRSRSWCRSSWSQRWCQQRSPWPALWWAAWWRGGGDRAASFRKRPAHWVLSAVHCSGWKTRLHALLNRDSIDCWQSNVDTAITYFCQ